MFCKANNISISKNKKEYMNVGGYWHPDKPNLFWRLIHKFNSFGLKYRTLKYRHKDLVWDVYHSRAYFALTLPCVEMLVNNFKNNSTYNKYIEHRFPPDEIYIATLIHNSKYKDNIWDKIIYNRDGTATMIDLTYFEYPTITTVFRDRTDYEWLKNTGCLFVRKINSSSKELIDEIDRNIL